MQPVISLIVPVKNRLQHLYTYFGSLVQQEKLVYELIVIDYYSTDDTLLFLEDYRTINNSLKASIRILTVKPNPGENLGFNLSKARNIGCYNAKASLCMTVDADVEFIKSYTLFEWLKLYNIYNEFVTHYHYYTTKNYHEDKGILPYCGGGNMIFHKSLFERADGFPHFIKNHGSEDKIFRHRCERVGGVAYENFHQKRPNLVMTYPVNEKGYIPVKSIWEDPTQNTKDLYNRIMISNQDLLYQKNDALPKYVEL